MAEREFNKWWTIQQYIEPIGDERGDYHAALIASKQSPKPVDAQPFAIKTPPSAKAIGRAMRQSQSRVKRLSK